MIRIAAALSVCFAVGLPAEALAADAKARKKLFERQSAILDKRNAQRATAPVRLAPAEVYIPGVPSSEPIVKYNGAHRSKFESAARKAARRHNVPEDLFLRLTGHALRA